MRFVPWMHAAFDHRGNERGKSWRCPAGFVRQFHMDEIQALERVIALHRPIKMHAARGAGMALDQRGGIDHLQLVAVFQHPHLAFRHHADHREDGAFRLPAFRAAAGMIEKNLAVDRHLHRPVRAVAGEGAAGKTFHLRLDAVID